MWLRGLPCDSIYLILFSTLDYCSYYFKNYSANGLSESKNFFWCQISADISTNVKKSYKGSFLNKNVFTKVAWT